MKTQKKEQITKAVRITLNSNGNYNIYCFDDPDEMARFYAQKKIDLYPFDVWTVEYINI